jgi:hypothetical protein
MSWNMLEPRMSFPMGTKLMLGAAVAAAAICRVGGKSPPLLTIVVVGMAVPSGAVLAMLVGMFKDPTSQNLWPLAMAALAVTALAASSVGTLSGSLLVALWRGVSGVRNTK